MARRSRHEEHQNHERWAIPYADLMTLLLAFFVVMYAISSVNEGKYRVLSDSIIAAFRGTPMTLEPVQAGSKRIGQGADLTSIARQFQVDGQSLLTPISRPDDQLADGRPSDGDPGFIDLALGAGGEQTLERVAASVEEAMRDLIERGVVAVRRKRDSVEVEIRTDILFPSGQSQLTPSARGIIERIGEALRPFPNALNVEGHTDNVPINTPLFPSNWELSAARAASVVHLLTEGGIAPSRLTVIGYADQQPLRSNDTAEGRNANRRVLLVVRGTPEADTVQVATATEP